MRSAVTMRFAAALLFIALLPLCSAQGVGGPPKDLIKAIDSNNPALVNVALKSFGKVNAKGEDGDTALMRACRNGRYKAVKALIKGKADATIPDAQGKTVMHVAAEAKDAGRTLQALLPAGLDPNPLHSDGMRPIHRAILSGDTDAVKTLLNAEVPADIPTEEVKEEDVLIFPSKTPMELAETLSDVSKVKREPSPRGAMIAVLEKYARTKTEL